MSIAAPQTIHWLFLTGAIWILIAVMVPFRFFKTLWLPALITGFILTFALNFIAEEYLHLWRLQPAAFTIFKTPLFLALSWYGAILVFDYLVLVYSRFKVPLIFLFAVLTTLIFWDASKEGHLKLENWSLAETLFVAVITYGISILVLKCFTKGDDLAANERPLGNKE
jgi:hypothetical protein